MVKGLGWAEACVVETGLALILIAENSPRGGTSGIHPPQHPCVDAVARRKAGKQRVGDREGENVHAAKLRVQATV